MFCWHQELAKTAGFGSVSQRYRVRILGSASGSVTKFHGSGTLEKILKTFSVTESSSTGLALIVHRSETKLSMKHCTEFNRLCESALLYKYRLPCFRPMLWIRIRIQSGCWIRIRNPDRNPGTTKMTIINFYYFFY
jgi:hypothetical protein